MDLILPDDEGDLLDYDLMAEGDPDDDLEDMLDDAGDVMDWGDVGFSPFAEEGGLFSKLRKRLKRRGLFGIKGRRRAKRAKKRARAMAARRAAAAAEKASTVTVMPKNTPTSVGGATFIKVKDCNLAISPIPTEARVPIDASKTMMLMSEGFAPEKPIVVSGTKASGTLYVNADPIEGIGYPPDGFWAIKRGLWCPAVLVEVGLPGVSAAAGVPISLSVYSALYEVDPSGGVPTYPVTPTPVSPTRGVEGVFDSGLITVTPHSTMKVASIMILPYDIVQGIPRPKLIWHGMQQHTVVGGYQDKATAYGLTVRCTAAPLNSNVSLSIITPGHPAWMELMAHLGMV